MNGTAPSWDSPGSIWLDRLQALLEVLLVSGLVSSLVAMLPFSFRGGVDLLALKDARVVAGFILLEAVIALSLVMLILRVRGETLESLGLRREGWISDALAGIGLVPVLFLTNIAVTIVVRTYWPHYFMDRNPLIEIVRTPPDLLLFLASGLFAGGIKEELQRAFVLVRFRKHLGGATIGLILWSIAFGAGHYVQGVQGAIAAGLFGLAFGILYLVRQSLIAPMVAHALYDVITLLGFWFFGRG